MNLLVTEAMAETAAKAPVLSSQVSGLSQIAILAGFLIIFYLLLWRPQLKRAKEQRNLLASLAVGDEVVTNGGLLGKVSKLHDDLINVKIAEGVEITLQKAAVTTILPKGTLKSI